MRDDRFSRRATLRLSGVALAGIAGCASQSSRRTRTPTAAEPTYSNELDTPATRTLRNATGDPAVTSSAHDPMDAMESNPWNDERWPVNTGTERDALEFAEGTTGVESARAFLAATDLAETTLLVHQYRLERCQTLTLERLRWQSTPHGSDVMLRYSHEPAEDCRDGASKPSEATLIRVPDEIARISSFGYQY